MRVIISGGGSGGHVFPAIAIADAIRTLKPDSHILFVGAKGKMEMEKVPKAGYPIEGLWISGLDRKLTKRNLSFPFKLMSSLWKSRKIIRKFNPDIAVGVGGYASGPLLHRASGMGIPTLIQEQNSYAGITNKLLAKRVDKICVAYDHMDRFFPSEKIVKTGNPVRSTIYDHHLEPAACRKKWGLNPENKTILVFGGSLGARTLNKAIIHQLDLFYQRKDINLIWQVGKLYAEEYLPAKPADLTNVVALPFIDDMAAAYTAADIVVCRAGALTIAELQMIGKASILVPSPNVAEDHQTKNAQALVTQDAAILVPDHSAEDSLIRKAIQLLDEPDQQRKLSQNILKMKNKDAAIKIAEEVIKLTRRL